MEKIKLKRQGYFPLRKLKLNVNNQTYLLKGNEEIILDLPSREIDIYMKMDWWHTKQKVIMSPKENSIVIKHCFSNRYFYVSLPILFIISVLTYLQIIPINLLVIFLLVFVLSQVYYLLFEPNKYFKVIKGDIDQ